MKSRNEAHQGDEKQPEKITQEIQIGQKVLRRYYSVR